MKRNSVFISHATPDDDDFTKWLALKLISLGYEVWCDILFLDKGVDFWLDIEKEIRENTRKFLIVSSTASNKRDGVLKELAVATKVKKQIVDDSFIIPLSIDETLSYDDINIEIVRLNAVDFKKSWAEGLQDLLSAFEKGSVPKNTPSHSKSNLLYQQIFLHNKGIIDKEEIYHSNWFPIISFPEELRFHKYEWRIPKHFDVRTLTFPAISYKEYLCTFAWEYDFMHQLPKTEKYSSSGTIRIPTSDIFSGNYNTDFIKNSECQRLIVQLINKAFELRMKHKDVREYELSNKLAYWIEKDKIKKNKIDKILLIGKQKEKNWHFGISAAAKLYPVHVLMVSTHIFFTTDGNNLIESKHIQHSSRRKQGKDWWNDKWRDKMNAFVKYISDDENSFYLEMGSEEKINISNESLKFHGLKSYNNPTTLSLDDEPDYDDFYEYEDETEEIENPE